MSRHTTARAQSETVGVVLLLGVFVVAAGAVGVALVGDLTSGGDEVVVSADLEADGTDLRVSHLGGDTLPNEELAVIVRADGNATRISFAPPEGRFSPGTERVFADVLTTNATNEVRLVHEPSGTEIERASLRPTIEPETETGAIEGTVRGPDAASLRFASGASFGIRQAAGPLSGATVAVDGAGRVAETTTGAGGTYRIDGLEPGEYELSVTAADLLPVTRTVAVRPNRTTTVDVTLDPLAPAEFAVRIDDVDARLTGGEQVTLNATVENVGDEEGTQRIEFSAAGAVVESETLTLAGGEERDLPLTWRPGPTDVGAVELAVASEDETATTTVEVLDPEGDGVAYVDRNGDGTADETFSATDLADRGEFDGHLVVFDDAAIRGEFSVAADRITVRDGVTVSARSVDLVATGDVAIGGATVDTSFSGIFGFSGGDVEIESGDRILARGTTVTTRAFFDAGDVVLSAEDDVDLTNGAFDARATVGFFGSDGAIAVESTAGSVTTDGAWFAPEPTVASDDG